MINVLPTPSKILCLSRYELGGKCQKWHGVATRKSQNLIKKPSARAINKSNGCSSIQFLLSIGSFIKYFGARKLKKDLLRLSCGKKVSFPWTFPQRVFSGRIILFFWALVQSCPGSPIIYHWVSTSLASEQWKGTALMTFFIWKIEVPEHFLIARPK